MIEVDKINKEEKYDIDWFEALKSLAFLFFLILGTFLAIFGDLRETIIGIFIIFVGYKIWD